MSTSDMPIPRTATMEEAMAALSDDPVAYNLPADAPEEQVQKAKATAAANLVAGSAANAAYWNSRSELEQFVARATGHGVIAAPPEDETPTGVAGPTETGGEPVESSARPVGALPTTEAAAEPPAPAADDAEHGNLSAEDRLRAQLRAANIEPEV